MPPAKIASSSPPIGILIIGLFQFVLACTIVAQAMQLPGTQFIAILIRLCLSFGLALAAIGLWFLKRWAYWLNAILYVFLLVAAVSNGIGLGIIILGVIVAYLSRRKIYTLFQSGGQCEP